MWTRMIGIKFNVPIINSGEGYALSSAFHCNLVLCLAALAASAESRLLYVTPTSPASSRCPGSEPCLTLEQYITSYNTYITSDTVIKFLPGKHTISRPFVARNVENITLKGSAEGDANPLVQLLVASGE